MHAEMPNDASAEKPGSSEYDDGAPLSPGCHCLLSQPFVASYCWGSISSFSSRIYYRSISPNTISSDPMIAETSASMCPRLRKSIACRCANEGARILHL